MYELRSIVGCRMKTTIRLNRTLNMYLAKKLSVFSEDHSKYSYKTLLIMSNLDYLSDKLET